jgi:hypothetical protein
MELELHEGRFFEKKIMALECFKKSGQKILM